jgi:hypothetical protein
MSTKIAFSVWAAASLLLTALAVSESTAIAQVCPPVGSNTDCGTIIKIYDNYSDVSHTSQGPFDDGHDDTSVGVLNYSSRPISRIGLGSGLAIFAFDGDGICSDFVFPIPTGCPFGPTGYEGPGVTFTDFNSSFTEGTITFNPPIPALVGTVPGTGYFGLEARLNATPSCPDGINHSLRAFTSASGSRPNVVMNAEFTPRNSVGVPSINDAATNCGFQKFNWISEITVPAPVPFWKMPAKSDATRLLADTAYNDPVQGGYTYDPSWNSYPYFWDVIINDTDHSLIHSDPNRNNLTATTLKFQDKPSDACLPSSDALGGTANQIGECAVPTTLNTVGSGHYAAAGSKLKFTTRVVGIRNSAPLVPVELGIFFKWESTFTGTVGSASRTANLQDPDPGIGTGGITITEVQDVTNYHYNGIAVTTVNGAPIEGETIPPTITVSATPSKLWPPNKLILPVTVSGTMRDTGGTGVNLSTAAYVVRDEYGLVEPKGAVTLSASGSYSFTIQLQASRKGDDKDGRQYHITVSAEDNAGNKGSSSTQVIVPHDQRHDQKDDREHDRKDDRGDDQKHDERDDRKHDQRH